MQTSFLDKCSKNAQISNFTKIRPIGAELFHANGQTKLIVAFHNFANMSKNQYMVVLTVIVYSRTAQET